MIKCDRQRDVASFLLGALSLGEERELMVHLAGCAHCQDTLRELGHLPQMLALVPRSLAERLFQDDCTGVAGRDRRQPTAAAHGTAVAGRSGRLSRSTTVRSGR